jgi:3'-phosphoadenosine 5'-phosphosulfate sulfotransferase (PAPS reductase)/FAD synthetase
MDDIVQVSFSGGRSSAMMAKIMLDNYQKERLIFTFANTGKEMPETLDFVHECDVRWGLGVVWIEYGIDKGYKVVSYETASRNGEPFEALITKRNYLPNQQTRFCTSDLKVKPMKRYLVAQGYKHWSAALGIRKDEPNRYFKLKNQNKKERWDYIFPLWEFGITKTDVANFWKQQGFDLAINSQLGNCDFCFLKGMGKKLSQARLMPERLQWWIDMEAKIGATFHKGYSYAELAQLNKNPTLFDEPEIGCFCGD